MGAAAAPAGPPAPPGCRARETGAPAGSRGPPASRSHGALGSLGTCAHVCRARAGARTHVPSLCCGRCAGASLGRAHWPVRGRVTGTPGGAPACERLWGAVRLTVGADTARQSLGGRWGCGPRAVVPRRRCVSCCRDAPADPGGREGSTPLARTHAGLAASAGTRGVMAEQCRPRLPPSGQENPGQHLCGPVAAWDGCLGSTFDALGLGCPAPAPSPRPASVCLQLGRGLPFSRAWGAVGLRTPARAAGRGPVSVIGRQGGWGRPCVCDWPSAPQAAGHWPPEWRPQPVPGWEPCPCTHAVVGHRVGQGRSPRFELGDGGTCPATRERGGDPEQDCHSRCLQTRQMTFGVTEPSQARVPWPPRGRGQLQRQLHSVPSCGRTA